MLVYTEISDTLSTGQDMDTIIYKLHQSRLPTQVENLVTIELNDHIFIQTNVQQHFYTGQARDLLWEMSQLYGSLGQEITAES